MSAAINLNGGSDGHGAGTDGLPNLTLAAGGNVAPPSGPLRLLITLAVMLPLTVFALVSWADRQAVLRNAERSAMQIVAVLHEHAQKVFETHELTLRLVDERLRGMPWSEVERSRELYDFLQRLDARLEQIGTVWIVAPDGRVVHGSSIFPPPHQQDGERPYLEAIRAGEQLHISEIYRGQPSNLPLFSMALRRESESGAFDGGIVATVSVQYLEAFYATVLPDEDRVISLTRSSGHQLVRHPAIEEPQRFMPGSAIMKAIVAGDQGLFVTAGRTEGIERIVAYKRLKDYPVFVTFGLSKSDVLVDWYKNMLGFAAIAVAASLSLLSITWLAYKRVQSQAALQQGLMRTKRELEAIMRERTAALSASEQRLRLATEAAELGAFEWRVDDDVMVWENSRMYEIFARSPGDGPIGRAQLLESVVDPADVADVVTALKASVEAGSVHIVCRIRRPDGVRWIELLGRFVQGPDGMPARLIGMVADITERKIGEEHLRLLMGELNHRVKNTLASVQSMAFQTARNATSIQEFRDAYWARLAALARAHDVLTRHAWEGAQLYEVAQETLAPYGVDERIGIDGPPVTLAPNGAVTLSMVLHELATNAAKYGALSVPDGSVSLQWKVIEDHPPAVEMVWRESGGPAVTRPTRRGFGSRLITQGPVHDLDATVSLRFDSEGVVCTITIPVSARLSVGETLVVPRQAMTSRLPLSS